MSRLQCWPLAAGLWPLASATATSMSYNTKLPGKDGLKLNGIMFFPAKIGMPKVFSFFTSSTNMSEPLDPFSHPNINPKPPFWSLQCPNCAQVSLKEPEECKGTGVIIENYGRWYQKCYKCGVYIWHNHPTNPNQIPPHVREVLEYRKSLQSPASHAERIPCQEPGCTTAARQPRDANRLCQAVPVRCLACCIRLGGCSFKGHRIVPASESNIGQGSSTQPSPSNSQTSASQVSVESRSFQPQVSYTQPPASQPFSGSSSQALQPRTYARALTGQYGTAYRDAQRQRESNRRPIYMTVLSSQPGYLLVRDDQAIMSFFKDAQLISVFQPSQGDWVIQSIDIPVSVHRDVRLLIRPITIELEDCISIDEEVSKALQESMLLPSSSRFSARRTASRVAVASSSHQSLPPQSQTTPPPQPHLNPVLGNAQQETSLSSLSALSVPPDFAPLAFPDLQERQIGPVPFPRISATTMLIGLRPMLTMINRPEKEIKAEFSKQFPGSVYRKSTLNTFRNARGPSIFNKYLNYGAAEAGSWKAFRKEVDTIFPSTGEHLNITLTQITEVLEKVHWPEDATEPPASSSSSEPSSSQSQPASTQEEASSLGDSSSTPQSSPSPPVITITSSTGITPQGEPDSDEDIEYEVGQVTIQRYVYSEGQLSLESGNHGVDLYELQIDLNARASGEVMDIYFEVTRWDNTRCLRPKPIKIKVMSSPSISENLPSRGSEVPSMQMAGMRAVAWLSAISFIKLLFDWQPDWMSSFLPNLDADISVLPTFLGSSDCPLFEAKVIQPWSSGSLFKSQDAHVQLFQDDQDNTTPPESDTLILATLRAFSHYVFQFTEQRMAMHDFQGHMSEGPNGVSLSIYDCVVHALGREEGMLQPPYRNSLGQTGIHHFQQFHICSDICHYLGLPAIIPPPPKDDLLSQP
ncbi:hypothetical protein BDN70DRAFT_901919 [Pholiota conissans]|uniref:Alpha-type protein kinase domain-containing protein n=1 Tax=Pholiota conissans TaxID=109636 RepID=A0A9P5YLB5_9AGAR|nr:hypothetical protein BDN70DRAFT_901919 [Pholiota conissans]